MAMASTKDGPIGRGEVDVSVAPIDLRTPRSYQVSPLPGSAYAVAAVALLVAGCSAPTASAPSQSLSPATSAPVTSPGGTPMMTFASSMAPVRLPAAVSRPTVFAAAGGLLIVGDPTGDTAYLVGGESPRPVDTAIQARAQAGGTP